MVTPNELEDPIQGALGLSHLTVTRKQMQKQSFGLTLSSQGLYSLVLLCGGPLWGAVLVRTAGLRNAGPVISLAFLPVSPHAQTLDPGQQQQ